MAVAFGENLPGPHLGVDGQRELDNNVIRWSAMHNRAGSRAEEGIVPDGSWSTDPLLKDFARSWIERVAARFQADAGPILDWYEAYVRAWGNPQSAAFMALREFDLSA